MTVRVTKQGSHPFDMMKTVTELPARSILSLPSPAPSLEAGDELAPADVEAEPGGTDPLNGTSAGSGFAGTTCVALFTSFEAP